MSKFRKPNYELTYGISDVAITFEVNRDLVKKWAFQFADYLSKAANPPKGTPRVFNIIDFLIFAYISMYWEDEPDLEEIKIGLNREDFLEEPFINLITEKIPIFIDPPDELCEDWRHGALYMAGCIDKFELADSYKLAGDILVDYALTKDRTNEILYPIVYNYRHATELYLKAIINKEIISHDFKEILPHFKQILAAELNVIIPEWFENIFNVFNDFDPNSTTFRYGSKSNYNEKWIDFIHLKNIMDNLATSLSRVWCLYKNILVLEEFKPEECAR